MEIEKKYKEIKRRKTYENTKRIPVIIICLIFLVGIPVLLSLFHFLGEQYKNADIVYDNISPSINAMEIPEYSNSPYVVLNDNEPFFDYNDANKGIFEIFSDLDRLGRCGTAYANLCKELMPTQTRGEIGMIRPSGWHTVKYPGVIEDLFLYNRCHLIAHSLAGEDANEKNLITGTRYFNTVGMLQFENEVRDYIERTDNHVLYRVTPIFEGENLLAKGVIMEAYSVEDQGKGICYNVFVYNVQPGIILDYSDGNSYKK